MYIDLLVRIKNGVRAKKETVQARFSKFDFEVAQVLKNAGYLEDVQKRTVGKRSLLEVRPAYKDGVPVFSDFKLKSTSGRRTYAGYRELRPIRQGYGMAVLSTPEGILTAKDARKRKVGGEYLFEIW